jgi:predicted nuclease with TOPRIM domain
LSEKEEYYKYLLNIFEASNKKDLSMNIQGLNIVTGVIFKLTQRLYDGGEQLKYHNRELENKHYRYGLANHSIIKLMEGIKFELIGHEIQTVDIFSIKSIVRMQIESYLIMFYLFFDNVHFSEKDLRYSIYKLHGIKKQMGFAHKSEFAKRQYLKAKEEVEEIQEKIKESETYKISNEKEKNKLLNPRYSILFDKKELFDRGNLNKTRINDMWSLFSNYAHAEHISDRHFNFYYKSKNASLKEDCVLILEINLILTAKLAILLANSNKSSKQAYKDLTTEEMAYTNVWGKT